MRKGVKVEPNCKYFGLQISKNKLAMFGSTFFKGRILKGGKVVFITKPSF